MAKRALYYDCFSGISGDMNLGALLDLGVPEAHLRGQLSRLGVDDEFTLVVEPATKMGIAGTKATVRLRSEAARHADASGHDHDHDHGHDHVHVDERGHTRSTASATPDDHTPHPSHVPHRNLADITAIIRSAELPVAVERSAIAIFTALAEAEARVHGTTVEAIHFHEVGATDAIVDIVGAAICLHWLAVDTVLCGTVEVGGGMVRCAHGLMPVPAPATAALLTGAPCHYDRVPSETTTPTGAAILHATVDHFGPPNGFVAARIGHGAGQKDFTIPNVLRVMLGTVNDGESATPESIRGASALTTEHNVEIDANLDDMSPEACGPLLDALFAHGARDAFLTPIVMKKSRPAFRISVLADPDDEAALIDVLLTHSTTLGVRTHPVTKHMLAREARRIATRHGRVRVKIARRPDGSRTWKVEHDDIDAIAARTGIAYLEVRRQIDADVHAHLGNPQSTANDGESR